MGVVVGGAVDPRLPISLSNIRSQYIESSPLFPFSPDLSCPPASMNARKSFPLEGLFARADENNAAIKSGVIRGNIIVVFNYDFKEVIYQSLMSGMRKK